MTADKVYLFLHIIGALMIGGGVIAGSLLYASMRRTRSTAQLELLLRLAGRVPMITIVGALLAIITGAMLAVKIGLNFGAPWLSATFTLWFVVVALSAAVLGPAVGAAHELAARELAAGTQESEAAAAAIASPRMRLTHRVLEASLLMFVYLMVFQPGA